MRRSLLVAGLLFAVGCASSTEGERERGALVHAGEPRSHSLTKTEEDTRPAFRLDPTDPFWIEFGRGSGYHGLETVKVGQDGSVEVVRMAGSSWRNWERASFQLPPEAIEKVIEAVQSNRLLQMHKAYHADVVDGTQWVLWIRQGARERSVYFDNHFPEPILRFAARLDEILTVEAPGKLRWKAASKDHAAGLWDSIRR